MTILFEDEYYATVLLNRQLPFYNGISLAENSLKSRVVITIKMYTKARNSFFF